MAGLLAEQWPAPDVMLISWRTQYSYMSSSIGSRNEVESQLSQTERELRIVTTTSVIAVAALSGGVVGFMIGADKVLRALGKGTVLEQPDFISGFMLMVILVSILMLGLGVVCWVLQRRRDDLRLRFSERSSQQQRGRANRGPRTI